MSPYRILIADDNHDHVLLTADAVASANVGPVETRVARDGREALAALLTGEWLPDLVLLDVQMPIVDGFEVLRRMRANERLRSIPVVLLTSSADDRDAARGRGLGSTAFVTKPLDGAALRDLLSPVQSNHPGATAPARVEVHP
jgi:CheY-like chemotaxis protein